MDEDAIVLVLARASELRSKIANCIHNASSIGTINGTKQEGGAEDKAEQEEEEEEAESLLNIRDSLEALEAQLSSLQALQQQQWYEKEASLADIDNSREKLLKKLKDYKGKDLQVIHEAITFASSTVEMENNDLLLPPYPTRPHFSSTPKTCQTPIDEPKGKVHHSEPKLSLKKVRQIIGVAAKTVFTLVGFIAILHLSGFEPIRAQKGREEKTKMVDECPPGKVLVLENGETRCLVKERVEIPFENVFTVPDVNYGCG